MYTSRVMVIKIVSMALFVLSADDSKQVTACPKYLSANS